MLVESATLMATDAEEPGGWGEGGTGATSIGG